MLQYGTPYGIRTPINGFGDRSVAITPHLHKLTFQRTNKKPLTFLLGVFCLILYQDTRSTGTPFAKPANAIKFMLHLLSSHFDHCPCVFIYLTLTSIVYLALFVNHYF